MATMHATQQTTQTCKIHAQGQPDANALIKMWEIWKKEKMRDRPRKRADEKQKQARITDTRTTHHP